MVAAKVPPPLPAENGGAEEDGEAGEVQGKQQQVGGLQDDLDGEVEAVEVAGHQLVARAEALLSRALDATKREADSLRSQQRHQLHELEALRDVIKNLKWVELGISLWKYTCNLISSYFYKVNLIFKLN